MRELPERRWTEKVVERLTPERVLLAQMNRETQRLMKDSFIAVFPVDENYQLAIHDAGRHARIFFLQEFIGRTEDGLIVCETMEAYGMAGIGIHGAVKIQHVTPEGLTVDRPGQPDISSTSPGDLEAETLARMGMDLSSTVDIESLSRIEESVTGSSKAIVKEVLAVARQIHPDTAILRI